MPRASLSAACALALALAACGSDPTHPQAPPGDRWVDVAGMRCADDSGTGIWISPGSSDDVLLVLSGGGACWSADRCPTGFFGNAVLRRFGATDFAALYASYVPGTLLDRSVPGNPFATWTYVFVPYCTGDVHAGGDVVGTYAGVTWRHHGFANLQAAVARMARELPRPAKVAVTGFSAGGFGSLLALDLVHAAWDPGSAASLDAALVDDSGPTFVGAATPPAILAAWWDAWGLASTVGTACPACATDLSQVWAGLHARHPSDRLALLSTTHDAVMESFFGVTATTPMSDADFAAGLAGLCDGVLAPPALDGKAACFRVAGTGHAMFWSPASYAAGATPLLDWLGKLTVGDPTWGPAGP